jgi:hypothetical protein
MTTEPRSGTLIRTIQRLHAIDDYTLFEMKVIQAARFSSLVFVIATVFTLFVSRTGYRIIGVTLPRQVWIVEHPALWAIGNWLWMLAIFSWMVVLVALMWSYSPAHRISSMLQSGLMIISATLLIAGLVVWMSLLPYSAGQQNAVDLIPFTDALALGLLGAGFFMSGAVTVWIGIELIRLKALAKEWALPAILAGLCWLPAPFLLPRVMFTVAGLLLWLAWCLVLGTRKSLPSAYAEWK